MKRKTAHKKKGSSRKISQRTSSRRLITILVVSIVFIVLAANIPVTTTLSAKADQSVLGEGEGGSGSSGSSEEENKEEEKKEEEQKEENKGSGNQEQKNEDQDNSSGSSPQLFKSKTDTVQNGFRIKTQSEGNKQETEIRGLNGQKIKTKVEDDGKTKVVVEDGGIKLKYVVENGEVKLKVENEDGEEEDADEEELDELEDEIENELEDEGIEIATGGGKIKFARNRVFAGTQFPLSVNVETNQLIVTTPAGQKVVAVLPDQAVQNLLRVGIINVIEGTGTDSAQLENIDSDIKLEIRNGEAVYKIRGMKKKKLFGFIPVETPVTAFVSAESGVPVAQEQSLLSNIINTLSR